MADPAKFKSVSVSVPTYKILKYLSEGKVTEATNSIRTFFSDKGNFLWITFAEGRLWYGVTDESPQITFKKRLAVYVQRKPTVL